MYSLFQSYGFKMSSERMPEELSLKTKSSLCVFDSMLEIPSDSPQYRRCGSIEMGQWAYIRILCRNKMPDNTFVPTLFKIKYYFLSSCVCVCMRVCNMDKRPVYCFENLRTWTEYGAYYVYLLWSCSTQTWQANAWHFLLLMMVNNKKCHWRIWERRAISSAKSLFKYSIWLFA